MRRAKIVCTLGPAVASPEGIASLVEAGMDVARMNLSHGAYADHERIYEWVRTAADAAGRGVGILVDLQGPKIRLGTFPTARSCSTWAPSSRSRSTTSPATSRSARRPTRACPAT